MTAKSAIANRLPVELEFVVNLSTAKALGLTLP